MLHQIGAGVLGPVFRAYQPDPGRLVAVKQFRLDIPPDSAHRFVAALERLIAADLTYSGIAAPLAAGLEQDFPYLAQDFVAAESFDVVMRDYGPAPVPDVLRVAAQLGGALDFAAAVGVFHGALHPRDVLVSTDETRVTGLGIAQALEALGISPPTRRPYTAPERIAGAAWDRRADVFSLAALAYEMLFGRRIAGVGPAAAESITAVEGSDPETLRDLFARALAEDPADRFETALSFAEALHAALGAAARPPKRPRTRRKRDTDPAIAQAVASYRANKPTLPLEGDLPLMMAADEDELTEEGQARLAGQAGQVGQAGLQGQARLEGQEGPQGQAGLAGQAGLQAGLNEDEEPKAFDFDDLDLHRDDLGLKEPVPTPVPDVDLGARATDVHDEVLAAHDLEDGGQVDPRYVNEDAALRAAEEERYAIAESTSALPETRELEIEHVPVEPAAPAAARARGFDEEHRTEDAGRSTSEDALPASVEERPAVAAVESEAADATSSSTFERTRSAIWPIVLALVVGLLVGYAFGYGMGTRDHGMSSASTEARSSEPTPVPEPSGASSNTQARDGASVPTPPPAARPEPAAPTPAAPRERQDAAPPSREPQTSAPRAAAPAERPGTAAGRITIRSRPSGARVMVDGRDAGSTPTTVRALANGTHVVRIAHQGYVTAERRVRIRSAQPAQSIEVDLEATRPARQAAPQPAPERTSGLPADAPGAKAGSLMVDSRPAGARVFVDGKMVGTTPLLLDAVAAGDHDVRLELDGFNPWRSPAKVTGGERTRVSGSLEQR